MKFLVDAQLPRRLARQLAVAGHGVLHTFDLPDGNRTSDLVIMERADREDRVVRFDSCYSIWFTQNTGMKRVFLQRRWAAIREILCTQSTTK